MRQQQRRTSARRKTHARNAVIASVLGVVVVGSVVSYATGVFKNDDNKSDAAAEASPSPSAPSKAPDPGDKAAAGKVKSLSYKKEPDMTTTSTSRRTTR